MSDIITTAIAHGAPSTNKLGGHDSRLEPFACSKMLALLLGKVDHFYAF